MKELIIRAASGFLYVALFILSLQSQYALIALFFVFGLICMAEFNSLIGMKGLVPYLLFVLIYGFFSCFPLVFELRSGYRESVTILHVLTIFVQLILIKDLFSNKPLPAFITGRYINNIFYITSAFVFMIQIANYNESYSPNLLFGAFILIWVNDSFAYLVGRTLGKQKLFPSISPKKTVEGFLGGLFFACVASYFISLYTHRFDFNTWLLLAIAACVFGTLGDLIESKFKRQANVKDSGIIMPGHGGLLDRLDSIIFASPFLYLLMIII